MQVVVDESIETSSLLKSPILVEGALEPEELTVFEAEAGDGG
jgi:hypothetical protein